MRVVNTHLRPLVGRKLVSQKASDNSYKSGTCPCVRLAMK